MSKKISNDSAIASKDIAFQNRKKVTRAKKLISANKELAFQNIEKARSAEELIIANKELAFQYREKEKRAAELIIANKELAFQNREKENRAAELIIANKELAFQNAEKEKRAAELIIANKELAHQNKEKEKRAAKLIIANKDFAHQNQEKEKRAAELIIANKELAFQNKEKEKRAAELIIANKELAIQNKEKENRAAELIIANKELAFQNREKEKRADELVMANKELAFQNTEKEKRADEVVLANKELALQNEEKEKRAAELVIANKKLAFQNKEKGKRADELAKANKELAFQNREKEKRADELIMANKELAFQNEEKENRAAELIVANKELAYQNSEKEKRAAEVIVANKELAYQNVEKEKKAAKLIVANKELAFQNQEKEKRAAELIVANKELAFQNKEKEKRAAELIIANKELAYQNQEKEKKAAKLIIANKELAFQNEEKEKRAAELIIANKELALQNAEKERRAAKLVIANKELAFQNEEKEKRAAELIIANKELAFQNTEKEKRAAELNIADKELIYQNEEKDKRAAELVIANKELDYQNEEKEKRAAELTIADKELIFQNEEKEKRADELIIANKELVYQNEEKEKRADELIIANKELVFQNEEKEKRAAELSIADKELVYQKKEKGKRAAELVIADKELVFQNEEKQKRVEELIVTNKVIEDLVAERISALHESEEKMNFFIDNASDYAIIFFDINGNVTSWNRGAQRISLYQSQEIIGQNFSIFFTESDRITNKPQQLLDKAKADEHSEDEGWRVRKDGSVYWEAVTIIALRKVDGTHYGYVKIAHDLSERKQAEEEINKLNETLEEKVIERTLQLKVANEKLLLQNEEKAKYVALLKDSSELNMKVIESSSIGIFACRNDGPCIIANSAVARITGGTVEQLLQINFRNLATWKENGLLEKVESALKTGKEQNAVVHLTTTYGRDIWLTYYVTTFQNAGELHFLMLVEDITERKLAELEILKKTEEIKLMSNELEIIIDSIPGLVFYKDTNNRFIRVNKYMCDTYKLSKKQMEGIHLNELHTEEQAKAYFDIDLEVINSGQPKINIDEPWDTESGKRWINTSKIPHLNEKNKVIGIIGISMDVTERKLAEIELEQYRNHLENANKELESFSYSVSHDLRAPLRHIGGFVDLVIKNYSSSLDEAGIRYLNIISESSVEMGNLIDALLAFSRFSRAELQRTNVNSKNMVTRVLKTFSDELLSRNVEINVLELPDVMGDESLINQVWVNLISNALKYSRNKEKSLIEIGGKIEDDTTVFYVKDNGVGFDMKYADKLFGVFQRLHKAKDFEGIGIGLANVNRIVTRHGGKCWAESEVGKGAKFSFSIPVN